MSCPVNPSANPILWKQLNQFLNTEKIDSIALDEFKNQLESIFALRKTLDVYLLLGAVASLENNLDEVHHYYQQAIEEFSKKADILASYAESLARIGHFSAATDLMLEAYYLLPGGIDYLEEAIYLCGVTGRFHFVNELLRIKVKLESINASSFQTLIKEIVQFMDEKQVTDEELEKLINTTLTLLHRYNINVKPQQISFSMEQKESKWFRYAIQINTPINEIIQLNSEVAEELLFAGISQAARTYFLPIFENF